jgi:hypothetical protein
MASDTAQTVSKSLNRYFVKSLGPHGHAAAIPSTPAVAIGIALELTSDCSVKTHLA